jgi:glutathione S-transferase
LALVASKLEHEVVVVRTSRGETQTAAFHALNPLGQVPTLIVDGQVVTEVSAILPLIADLAPAVNLLPKAPLERSRAQALMTYLAVNVHAAWDMVRHPYRFAESPAALGEVTERGVTRLAAAYGYLERQLSGNWAESENVNVAEIYLALFLAWRAAPQAKDRLPKTPRLDALQDRVLGRTDFKSIVDADRAAYFGES